MCPLPRQFARTRTVSRDVAHDRHPSAVQIAAQISFKPLPNARTRLRGLTATTLESHFRMQMLCLEITGSDWDLPEGVAVGLFKNMV